MYSQKSIIKISQKTNGRCFYCNKDGEEVDHFISKYWWRLFNLEITPLSGGLNSIENLFLSCFNCNSKKRNKTPEEFMGNDYIAWSRYNRANYRIGLSDSRTYER